MSKAFKVGNKAYRILSKCALRENTDEKQILRRAIALYQLLSDKYSGVTRNILIVDNNGNNALDVEFGWQGQESAKKKKGEKK